MPRVPGRAQSALEAHERLALGRDALDARRAVVSLRMRGGFHAMRILLRVAEQGALEARAEAIQALGLVGIRTEKVLTLLRARAADTERVGERVAALEALGRIGGGSDVPLLLKALRAKQRSLRTVAWASIERLSGERLPASWTLMEKWWARHEKRQRRYLEAALELMPDAVKDDREREVMGHRDTIARLGWLDLTAVDASVKAWLGSKHERMRDEAFYAIASLKLGDYAPEVAAERANRSATTLVRCPGALVARHELGLDG
ncbi:MAG: hypothetical protein QNJ98_16410 [Planctomycetota bacterium]|nr:hypothetical protein [Planctomycetota bacterium]